MSTLQGPQTAIQPSQIDTTSADRFSKAFGDDGTGSAAWWIVKFCKRRNQGSWKPFRFQELTRYYMENDNTAFFGSDFPFYGLLRRGLVVLNKGDVVLTTEFVELCPKLAPSSA